MKKFKFLLIGFSAFALLFGCKKKEQEPEEYFRFYADGVKYEYLQEERDGGLFGVTVNTLGAFYQGWGMGYHIYGFSQQDPTAPGEFVFDLAMEFPDRDTVIIDGETNTVWVDRFLNSNDLYFHHSELPAGHIIFTEREGAKLKGTFEFHMELGRTEGLVQRVWTDTIIHITQGEFSIIPGQ